MRRESRSSAAGIGIGTRRSGHTPSAPQRVRLLGPEMWVIVGEVNREASMHLTAKPVLVAGAMALAASSFAPAVAKAQESEPIHVALADLPEVETLFFLVGLARAGERGLD